MLHGFRQVQHPLFLGSYLSVQIFSSNPRLLLSATPFINYYKHFIYSP